MAKLNTNVENLQLKSNKVSAPVPSASWTAEQYPSAKALYDAFNCIHPVGSVLCMSTNTNPAQVCGYGTWELVDKELAKLYVDLFSGTGWTDVNATSPEQSGCLVDGHSMTLRLMLKMTAPVNDETGIVLGIINYEQFGLTGLPMHKYGIPFTIDGGEITGNVTIETNGTVTLNDAWNPNGEHTINSSYSLPIHVSYTVSAGNMKDSFCNKFYFKRTA